MREEDGRREPTLMAAAAPDYMVSGVMKQSSNKRHRSLQSPASSSSSHSGSTTTQQQQQDEEADMARCLILLAQGPCAAVSVEVEPPMANKQRRSSYECKTCNKCFPSFQALGGHRTSHNNNAADSKKNKLRRPEPAAAAEHAVTTTLCLRPAAVAAAAHECSACGAAFASGQALGGHMRRHRPLTALPPESVVTTEERSNGVNLELDLNLLPGPAREQEVTSPAKGIMHHFKH
ncbi:unnamed protein product [Urochloa humidicola]